MSNQEPAVISVDLHVHSKFSTRPSIWVLRKIGCAESYTEPREVYRIAKSRGMRYVTISDHNTIDGALQIAHLPDAFVSEEVTTYFPEDQCKVHVLVLNITERQHADIQRLRENIYDFVGYLNRENIVHSLAHPTFSINDRLTPDHFEKLLLLFNIFEQNGTRDEVQNTIVADILRGLKQEDIERLADNHGLEPIGPTPWIKGQTGGSDDHSSLHIASMFTQADGVNSIAEFLEAVRHGRTRAAGVAASPRHMAHNLYSIAYQFYRQKLGFEKYATKEPIFRFGDAILLNGKVPEQNLVDRLGEFVNLSFSGAVRMPGASRSLQTQMREHAREILQGDPWMRKLLAGAEIDPDQKTEVWYRFVNGVTDRVLANFADTLLDNLTRANLFDLFHTIGSMGALYAMLAPYFMSYRIFIKDREVALNCRERLHSGPQPLPRRFKLAHFTDTFAEVNGVARTLKAQVRSALSNRRDLQLIVCGEGPDEPGVKNFAPIGKFALPEYEEIGLHYPPLLAMLDYCFEENFTHLHAATPGPLGLAALAIARILKIPIYATYHTSFPQYARHLVDDSDLEDLLWTGLVWFYNQMDVVYVPSRATGEELKARGVRESKIRFYERGIDVERFHPSKRNGYYHEKLGLGKEHFTLLYVGRVSKEKNLAHLVEIFRCVAEARPNVRLVVVGDGPYRVEMEQACAGLPVSFTGVLNGDELAQAYASADLFVFPSTTDTFGNVVLEAQASGIPVLVSDVGGPKENVLHAATGYVLKANDTKAFVKAIFELMDNPSIRERLGRDARHFVENRSFESGFLKLWDSYQQPIAT